MKYVLFCCTDEKTMRAMSRHEWDALGDDTRAYLGELRKSGHYLAAEALESVETSTTVRVRNGKLSTTDGPFAETKEQIGGFFLIDARDLDDAIHVASRFPSAAHGSVEVRPVRELAR